MSQDFSHFSGLLHHFILVILAPSPQHTRVDNQPARGQAQEIIRGCLKTTLNTLELFQHFLDAALDSEIESPITVIPAVSVNFDPQGRERWPQAVID